LERAGVRPLTAKSKIKNQKENQLIVNDSGMRYAKCGMRNLETGNWICEVRFNK
jgi:hypothetical protein